MEYYIWYHGLLVSLHLRDDRVGVHQRLHWAVLCEGRRADGDGVGGLYVINRLGILTNNQIWTQTEEIIMKTIGTSLSCLALNKLTTRSWNKFLVPSGTVSFACCSLNFNENVYKKAQTCAKKNEKVQCGRGCCWTMGCHLTSYIHAR